MMLTWKVDRIRIYLLQVLKVDDRYDISIILGPPFSLGGNASVGGDLAPKREGKA